MLRDWSISFYYRLVIVLVLHFKIEVSTYKQCQMLSACLDIFAYRHCLTIIAGKTISGQNINNEKIIKLFLRQN